MSEFQRRGVGASFEVGNTRARVADTRTPERTPEQKAQGARTIASNIKVQAKLVREQVTAMKTATAAAKLEDWRSASSSAEAGVAELERQVEAAVTAATEATDAQLRKCLVAAPKVLIAARKVLAGAAAAPKPRAPVLGCADALLSVLPPDHPVSPAEPVYAPAKNAVERIFRHQMTTSDIAALDAIIRDHKDHEITRRFMRFGKARQSSLLELLKEDEVKLPARAREAAQRRASGDGAAPADTTTTANGMRGFPGNEPAGPAMATIANAGDGASEVVAATRTVSDLPDNEPAEPIGEAHPSLGDDASEAVVAEPTGLAAAPGRAAAPRPGAARRSPRWFRA